MLSRIFAAPIVHFLYWNFSRFCFLGKTFQGAVFWLEKLEFIVGGEGDSPGGCERTEELKSGGLRRQKAEGMNR